MGEQTALLNQLQQLVFLIFPVLKNMKGKTAQYLLKKYTTPEKIATVFKEVLGEEMRKRSMGKFGIHQAELLIGLARETVGIKEGLGGHFPGHKAYPPVWDQRSLSARTEEGTCALACREPRPCTRAGEAFQVVDFYRIRRK